MSHFFHGLQTHQTCHPLSTFGMLWIDMYDNMLQFLPISSNHSHWIGVGQHSTGHNQQPDQLYAKEMCNTIWGKSEIHRLGPNEFISIDWFTYMNCNSVKSLKLLHVAFIFLFRVKRSASHQKRQIEK
jgi:hypothetical protein